MTTPDNNAPLFSDDLGLENVPKGFATGVYQGFVTNVRPHTYKDEAKGKAIIITYRCDVDPSGQFTGESIDEFKSCNSTDSNVKKRFLKQRLEELGVPESRQNSVTPSDLIGKPVYFTVKNDGQYINVTKVQLRDPSVAVGSSTAVPGVATTPANANAGSVADLI
jgi:hypothetical protein